MRRMGAMIVVGLLAAGAACPAGAVTLRYTPRPGATSTYRLHFSGQGTVGLLRQHDLSIEGETQVEVRVLAVAPNGNIEVEARCRQGQVSARLDGRESAISLPLNPAPFRVTLDSTGHVLAAQGLMDRPLPRLLFPVDLSQALAALAAVQLPAAAVPAGATWRETGSVPAPAGTRSITKRSRLVGFEALAGTECARIHTETEVPAGTFAPPDAPALAGGRVQKADTWISLADGKPLRRTTTLVGQARPLLAPSGSEFRLEVEMSAE